MKKPVEFTDEELKAIKGMFDGASIPTCIYNGVISASKKIDAYFGRSFKLEELVQAHKEKKKGSLAGDGGPVIPS